jgi:hypothetical protein
MSSFSIPNLIKQTDQIQNSISLEVVAEHSEDQNQADHLKSGLLCHLNDILQTAETILNQNQKSPADLAIRSRRAYQWIQFLTNRSHLTQHLNALEKINHHLPDVIRSCGKKKSGLIFSFYHISPLFKSRREGGNLAIVAQESFIFAPDHVLFSILKSGICQISNSNNDLIKNYTSSRAFQKIREHLEYLSIPPGGLAVGKHYDLQHSFNRLNQTYFRGQLPQPHLVWSSRLTRKKFGHYQEDTNTVSISSSLDQQRVPPYVLDYVMYHELLHMYLGVKNVNGRRYAHTREFKKEESRFKKLQEAQNVLNQLTRSPAR